MLFQKIDAQSVNSVTSALDLFTPPPTNVAVNNAEYREILSLNPVSVSPIHFKLHPGSNYVDLSKCYLLTEAKILKKDENGEWKDLADDAKVGCTQLPGATFIKNLRVSINGREVFDSNGLYAYKAYVDSEFTYADDVKNTYSAAAGYAADKQKQDDIVVNSGLAKRAKMFDGGHIAQFLTRLDADIFNQQLYLLSNTEVDIELQVHKAPFFVIAPNAAATDEFKLEIISCKLFAKYVELMDGLNLNMTAALNRVPAKYAIRRSELKSFTITAGRYQYSTTLFADQIPRRLAFLWWQRKTLKGTPRQALFILDTLMFEMQR